MKMRHLLALALLLCCSCKKQELKTSTFEELKAEVANAISTNDFKAIERLHYRTPEWLIESKPFMKKVLKEISRTEYTMQSTDHLPFWSEREIEIIPKPQKYISIIAYKNDTAFTLNFTAGKSENKWFLCYTNEGNKSEEIFYEYDLVVRDESELANLGPPKPQTFQASWDGGGNFKSYSMDNLANTLSTYSSSRVNNKTGIEGDFDFHMELHNTRIPSQIKIDLWQVGLDLVNPRLFVEETQN